MTPHLHNELLHAIANGEPLSNFEVCYWTGTSFTRLGENLVASVINTPGEWQVRRRDRHLRLNNVVFEAPERVEPAIGTKYYTVTLTKPLEPTAHEWTGTGTDRYWLSCGIVHLSRDAAIQHATALLATTNIEENYVDEDN